MVIFIKAESNIVNIDTICKTMLNIENNKTIFDNDGKLIPIDSRKSFSKYNINQVEYDISVSSGVVLLYLPNDTDLTVRDMIKNITSKINALEREFNIRTININRPINTGLYNCTTYTYLAKNLSTAEFDKPSYRKLVYDKYELRQVCKNGFGFTWFVNIIGSNDRHLKLSELCKTAPTQLYLMESLSTIIYDNRQLFNIDTMQKQVDYPKLSQYNMFVNGQVLKDSIHISRMYGLDYEILKCYMPDLIWNYSNFHCKKIKLDASHKIKRRDPNKEWFKQLQKPFDFAKQEMISAEYQESGKTPCLNDVCFITGAPLFNNVVLLKVSYNDDITTHTHILINANVYSAVFIVNNKNKNLYEYFISKKITILSEHIVAYNRNESEAIALIPEYLIDPVKKDIMESISINGIYKKTWAYYNQDHLYTVNIKKNKIYLGFENIYDHHILKYQNTNTILFNAVLY